MSIQDLKEQCYLGNRALHDRGLIDLTFGNASCIDRDLGLVAIKPSGVPYEDLTIDSMVLVDLNTGLSKKEELKPSSDTPTHLALYRKFPFIGGITHSHSKFATSFAQAGTAVPCMGTTHADYFSSNIPITRAMTEKEIKGEYELETGNVIIEALTGFNPLHHPGILVASHGPFSWGRNVSEAVENANALEIICQLAYQTLQINHQTKGINHTLHHRHFKRKHGRDAYYGQNMTGEDSLDLG